MREKVLIIDPDKTLEKQLSFTFSSNGWDLTTLNDIEDINEVIEFIAHETPDVILGNIVKEPNGDEILREIKRDNRMRLIPFLFFSEVGDLNKHKVKYYELGAANELCLPLYADIVVAKIKSLMTLQEELSNAIYLDPLTKAHNRRYFTRELKRQIGLHKRHSEEFSLSIFDLDHFKVVNDTYGHLVGDQCLKVFSEYVKNSIRSTDIFARWGGEEFVLILERSRLKGAIGTIEKILKGLKKERIVTDAGDHIQISFSAGVAQFPNHGESEMDLINAADTAVYAAKENGRSRIEAYYPD